MPTNYAVAPGEFLQEWIEEEGNGITQAELAQRLDVSRKLVNEIINGKAPITPGTAIRLGRVTSIPSDAWLRYEAQYQNDCARLRNDQQLKQHEGIVTPQLGAYLRKLGATTATMRDKTQVLSDLLSFTGYGTFESFSAGCSIKLGAALSTLRESSATYDEALMMTWLAAGERTAAYKRAHCLKYDRNGLKKLLPRLKERVLSADDTMLDDVIQLLDSVGVICQFIEPPEKFPIYGIVIWTRNGVPVIQLTGRRKKNNHVIWTLFHELGHILNDETRTTQLEFNTSSSKRKSEEVAANQFARDWLFGGSVSEYRGMNRAHDIEAMARQKGDVPCIVVQELHRKRMLDRSYCNQLIFDVRIPFQEQDYSPQNNSI